ncbi:hypothetical protein L7F22_027991 [Adiantum nelumboides]|nr:hypothetical protein [Adiantum nelumboides]
MTGPPPSPSLSVCELAMGAWHATGSPRQHLSVPLSGCASRAVRFDGQGLRLSPPPPPPPPFFCYVSRRCGCSPAAVGGRVPTIPCLLGVQRGSSRAGSG